MWKTRRIQNSTEFYFDEEEKCDIQTVRSENMGGGEIHLI